MPIAFLPSSLIFLLIISTDLAKLGAICSYSVQTLAQSSESAVFLLPGCFFEPGKVMQIN